jgi:hypothetical protein
MLDQMSDHGPVKTVMFSACLRRESLNTRLAALAAIVVRERGGTVEQAAMADARSLRRRWRHELERARALMIRTLPCKSVSDALGALTEGFRGDALAVSAVSVSLGPTTLTATRRCMK